MKNKVIYFGILCCVLMLNSCGKSPLEPELTPGRRDYTWTVDTLNPGQESLYLMHIWGSIASDVWAVGSSSWTATSIWHYNGKQWRCDSVSRGVNPDGIFGLTNNEVWLGNVGNIIWKYNGTQWQQFGNYKVEGFDRIVINNFDGTSINDIYAIGFAEVYNSNIAKAILMHYNGSVWSFVNIADTKVSFETVGIDPRSGVLVISGMIYDPSGFVPKVYCWDGKELKDLAFDSPGDTYVTKLGDEIFVSTGSKIYKYSDKNLELWKDNINTSTNGRLWCGRSRNDFFIHDNNGIGHYNGSDFTVLFKTSYDIWAGITFEKDVFFIAYDHFTGKNYIIHGQLK